ncbi:uncharacterized protein LOC131330135 isoform X3 [Rhododendron vialii]|uniref:uncharacterized protein LOC131330135 isoform X3 n=1 Tax=Rhododendron vialii TaxID=182163 RepID=UPI00265D8A52|nr:uncharacterized protein LOC131330135 isoform X3 [Rhododendron vialii]
MAYSDTYILLELICVFPVFVWCCVGSLLKFISRRVINWYICQQNQYMFIMDSKGITWVGNVYQKFEAMCLELEEAVCQDTVKFVENQAQTVGSSVKKFYSDVMEDLLLPSSIDPVKLAAADLSLNPYADFGVYKKSKASIKKDSIKPDKKGSEDSNVISGLNTDYSSSFSGLHDVNRMQPPYSMGPVKGTGLELCLEQNERIGAYKRKSRKYNHMPSEIPRSTTPMSKDTSKVSLNCGKTKNHGVMCGQIAMLSSPAAVDGTGCPSIGAKSHTNVSGSSAVSTGGDTIDTSTPSMMLPVESAANNQTKLRCTTLNGGPDLLAAELNAGACANSGVVSPVGSGISEDRQYFEKASDDRLSPAGACKLDGNDYRNVPVEAGLGTSNEQLDRSMLEETCVLVDTQEICPATQRKDKPRSYKKKIQKAFSSKRSARKQEYERLAVQHGDLEVESNQESAESLVLVFTIEADIKKLPPHGNNECDWELL